MAFTDYLLNPFVSEKFFNDAVDLPQNGSWGANGKVEDYGASGEFGYTSPGSPESRVYGGSGGIGQWHDKDGNVNTGANVETGLYKTGQQDSGYTLFGQDVGWDFGVGTANAGAFNKTGKRKDGKMQSTDSVGAGANAMEGSMTVGDESGSVRMGLSEGVGAAARKHMVDIDGDGEMETSGFGFDAGPVSFDVKSDMIAETLANAASVTDIMNGDFEMPDLDDYELNTDGYELPDITDVANLDGAADYLVPGGAPVVDSVVDFFTGGDEEEAPMPPTGLLDEDQIQEMQVQTQMSNLPDDGLCY